MRVIKTIAFSLLLLTYSIVIPALSKADNHYVLSNAGGNASGSDWSNAYTELPQSLIRGDVYYIGDGSYGGYNFDDPESGSTPIIVKKATSSDHGTSVGWNNSFGDGEAIFSSNSGDTIIFSTGYWIIDGVTGGNETGYGFKFTTTACNSTPVNLVRILISKPTSDITLSHINMEHCGEDQSNYRHSGVYVNNSNTMTNLTISNSYIHHVNFNQITLVNVTGFVLEYSILAYRHTENNDPHGQAIQLTTAGYNNWDADIRYNTFHSIYATAAVAMVSGGTHDNVRVYGNVASNTGGSTRYLMSNGFVAATTSNTATNISVFNNTIINWNQSGTLATGCDYYNGSNNICNNNIFFNVSNTGAWRNTVHDYNLYNNPVFSEQEPNGILWTSGNSLFLNYDNNDFRLTTSTPPGMRLSEPFNLDPNNNVRGADGIWDLGAFEYTGETVPPNPPSDLILY